MAFKLRSPAFAPGGDGPKPHRLERREGLGGDVAPRCPEHAEHEGHVLEDGAAGQKLGILEHDADGSPQAGDLRAAELRDVEAPHLDVALRRRLGPVEQPEQRGLVRAGWPKFWARIPAVAPARAGRSFPPRSGTSDRQVLAQARFRAACAPIALARELNL
jgi:hypothetical protein